MDKKAYETPAVTKVEFDASDRIAASAACEQYILLDGSTGEYDYDPTCKELD